MVWRRPDLSRFGRDGGALYVRGSHGWFSHYLWMLVPGAGTFLQRLLRATDPGFSEADPRRDAGVRGARHAAAGSGHRRLEDRPVHRNVGRANGGSPAVRIRDRIDCWDRAGLSMALPATNNMKPVIAI